MSNRAFRPRKSRLDPFAEVIGQEPDAVVARRAEVTPECRREVGLDFAGGCALGSKEVPRRWPAFSDLCCA